VIVSQLGPLRDAREQMLRPAPAAALPALGELPLEMIYIGALDRTY